MARAGINKALVQQARDTLLARGSTPSIEAVRVELGHTGSKTTISRYLRELAADEPRPPTVRLDEELLTYIGSLAQRLAADAQATVAADRARLERQQAAFQHQREVNQARYEELHKAHQLALQERQAASSREQQLHERLLQLEGGLQRLREVEVRQLQLLEERAAKIGSLEDKHSHARAALEHYREQQVHQRQEELTRHDLQVQQLQQELHRQQEQLMQKQEELSQVYRELEGLNAEQRNHIQQLRHQAQALEQETQRHRHLQTALQEEQAQCQALRLQLSVLHEKARRYVLDQRQDRRALRAQARQLTQLHALLSAQSARQSENE
ncbi:DNA-binding protein [Pseudomonas sp. LjRoot263]|uniref:DNA-binding protein n=1 Tax=Pseudomonas sp. LjRoot263 TaxID=3342302 RepID=UPI003ED10CD7